MSQVLIQRPSLDGLSQAGPWYRSRRDGFYLSEKEGASAFIVLRAEAGQSPGRVWLKGSRRH